MSAVLIAREPDAKTEMHLEDGGHVYLACSECENALVDIWSIRPFEPEVFSFRAKCPYCSSPKRVVYSDTKEIKGGFAPGGIFILKEDDPDDSHPVTDAELSDFIDDIGYFDVVISKDTKYPKGLTPKQVVRLNKEAKEKHAEENSQRPS